jgi:hypothetical protein
VLARDHRRRAARLDERAQDQRATPIMSTPSDGPASPVRDKGVYARLLAG